MKSLIFGAGSIGLRHGQILNELNIDVAFITKRTDLVYNSYLKMDQININNYDYFIIANETLYHYETLKKLTALVKNKIILIENPLFMESGFLDIKNNKCYVGYNLRFHPIVECIKENLINDDILINLRTHESIEKTFLNNVFSLPAGHSIKIGNKKIEIKKWWEIKNNLITVNYKNIYEDFYNIFIDSLKKTLVSDVKTAFTLSGGLDSSSLAMASNSINNEIGNKQKISPDFKNFFYLKYKNFEKYDDYVVNELKKTQNVKVLEIDK